MGDNCPDVRWVAQLISQQARRQDPPTATAAANAPPYPTALKTIFGWKRDNVRKTCLPIGDIPQRESPSGTSSLQEAGLRAGQHLRPNARPGNRRRPRSGPHPAWAAQVGRHRFKLRRLAGQPPRSPARLVDAPVRPASPAPCEDTRLKKAAAISGVARRTLERLIAVGEGPAQSIELSPRRRGILETDLRVWIQRRRRSPPGEAQPPSL